MCGACCGRTKMKKQTPTSCADVSSTYLFSRLNLFCRCAPHSRWFSVLQQHTCTYTIFKISNKLIEEFSTESKPGVHDVARTQIHDFLEAEREDVDGLSEVDARIDQL